MRRKNSTPRGINSSSPAPRPPDGNKWAVPRGCKTQGLLLPGRGKKCSPQRLQGLGFWWAVALRGILPCKRGRDKSTHFRGGESCDGARKKRREHACPSKTAQIAGVTAESGEALGTFQRPNLQPKPEKGSFARLRTNSRCGRTGSAGRDGQVRNTGRWQHEKNLASPVSTVGISASHPGAT